MMRTSDSFLPVAVYARYSTERQDSRSIDDQVRRCRAHATAHRYQVVSEFKDAAVSGSHVLRADMQRLLAAARAKPSNRGALSQPLTAEESRTSFGEPKKP